MSQVYYSRLKVSGHEQKDPDGITRNYSQGDYVPDTAQPPLYQRWPEKFERTDRIYTPKTQTSEPLPAVLQIPAKNEEPPVNPLAASYEWADIEKMSAKELVEFATGEEIDISGVKANDKKGLLEVIKKAFQE